MPPLTPPAAHAGVTAEEWAVGFTLEFSDGGPSLSCILGFADEDAAQRAVERLPLDQAPYSGPRPVHAAVLFACPTAALGPA